MCQCNAYVYFSTKLSCICVYSRVTTYAVFNFIPALFFLFFYRIFLLATKILHGKIQNVAFLVIVAILHANNSKITKYRSRVRIKYHSENVKFIECELNTRILFCFIVIHSDVQLIKLELQEDEVYLLLQNATYVFHCGIRKLLLANKLNIVHAETNPDLLSKNLKFAT